MASGHWETRRTTRTNPRTGELETVTIRVWVADPPSRAERRRNRAQKQAANQAARQAEAARARAASAARRRAQEAAQRRKAGEAEAYQKRIAESRRQAYESLAKRQSDLIRRAGIIKDKNKPPIQPVQAPIPNRNADAAEDSARARAAAVERQKQAIANQVAQREAAKRAALIGKTQINRFSGFGGLSATKTGVNDHRDAKSAENFVAGDAKGNGPVNPEDTRKMQEQYEKYAQGVYAKYKQTAAAINALLDKARNEKLGEGAREGALNRAKVLYNGPFRELQVEFTRLFGDGRKQGSYVAFYQNLDSIAAKQREWWKNQMKSSLQSRLMRLQETANRMGEDTYGEQQDVKQQIAIFNEDPKALGKTIDHYETRINKETGKKETVPVYRTKTVEEALQDQTARLIAEQEKQRAAMNAQATARNLMDRHLFGAEGLTRTPDGRVVDIQTERFRNQVFEDAQAIWGQNMPDMKREEDIQGIANTLLDQWETRNPEPANYGNYGQSALYAPWKFQRDKYEEQLYRFLSQGQRGTPGALERIIATPGISHGLALLQAGTSAIGGLARVGNAWVFGETKVGGYKVDLDELPPAMKRQLETEAQAFYDKIGSAGAGSKGAFSPGPSLDAWFKTPAGKAWYDAQITKAKQEGYDELKGFSEGFYGEDGIGFTGDAAGALDAMNAFGSEPFEDGGLNLAFQLLVDPTNAIPLKFTTYLARAKYAAELSKGASKVNPAKYLRAGKNFLTVDEGVLALEKKLSKYEADLRKSGLTAESAAEELREMLAGVKSSKEMEGIVDQWAKKVGLDPRELSEAQIFNLAEWSATRRAGESGTLFTQQKKLAQDIAAQRSAINRAKRQREAAKRAAARRVEESAKAVEADALAARTRLRTERVAEQEKAAAAAGRRAAALTREPSRAAPGLAPHSAVCSGAPDSPAGGGDQARRDEGPLAADVQEAREGPRDLRAVRGVARVLHARRWWQSDPQGPDLPVQHEGARVPRTGREGEEWRPAGAAATRLRGAADAQRLPDHRGGRGRCPDEQVHALCP
jgi:hypothetical protein